MWLQPISTNEWEVNYSVEVKNDKNTVYKKNQRGENVDDIEGFALWYLDELPNEGDMTAKQFGYKMNYNGMAVFVYKHQKKWRVSAMYNNGVEGGTVALIVALSKF